jgi:hypothetical protein
LEGFKDEEAIGRALELPMDKARTQEIKIFTFNFNSAYNLTEQRRRSMDGKSPMGRPNPGSARDLANHRRI